MKQKNNTKPQSKSKTVKKSSKTSMKSENGVKVGDRVYCVYQGRTFPVHGTAVAMFTYEFRNRIVVSHDDDVQMNIAWDPPFSGDTSVFKVWGAQFVFQLKE